MVLFFIAIQLKLDSSLGRLLIYKLTWNVWQQHYFTGVGRGYFGKYYLDEQARYFSAGHYSTKELLLADNTTYAFNDYLQIIVETGFAGLISVPPPGQVSALDRKIV